jgi:tripartite ATP-independent transporter DctM subunit
MVKRGYPKPYIAALNGFTALIVATIPPSIGLIIYGSVGEVSIGRLFAGGFVPGIIMLVFFMTLVRFTAKRRKWMPERSKPASLREVGRAFIDGIWALLFPVILIVGLRFGLFTPSESGAFACVYAIFVGMFVYKELTPKIFLQVLMDTGKDIGTIMLLICFSGIFGYGIVIDRVPQAISGFLMGISANEYVMMFIIVGVLLLIGLCIETTIIALLMTPILLPVAVRAGADPVQFGLIMMTTTTMAIMTPPMGIALFSTSSIIGCKIEETVVESLPFIAATLAVVTIMIFFPNVVLFIPNLIFG